MEVIVLGDGTGEIVNTNKNGVYCLESVSDSCEQVPWWQYGHMIIGRPLLIVQWCRHRFERVECCFVDLDALTVAKVHVVPIWTFFE